MLPKTLRRLSTLGGAAAAAVAIHVVRKRITDVKVEPRSERRRSDKQPAIQQPSTTRDRTYKPSSSVGFPLPSVLDPIKETVDEMGAAAFEACPQATQLAVALTAAAKEQVTVRRSDRAARQAEAQAIPYQGLEALHPGLSHPLTLERAGGRTPQYYLTPEQFVRLKQINPIVAWIAGNARFLKAGTCHGEAFAQVRRMGGLPTDPERLNWESTYPIVTDFQQISPDIIPAALKEGGVVVLKGTGQLVAEDSFQRSVESGGVSPWYLMNMNRIKESQGEVNHSVMLIDHPSDDPDGLVPEGYVIVYDPDPFAKRYANLHDPQTGRPVSSSGPPVPSVVPEADVHKLLRIVHLGDLIAETQQETIMPKASRPLFPLHFNLPQAPSTDEAGDTPVQLHVGSKGPSA
jgi:hypothetical protein